jgi:hypothetical protein
MTQRDKGVTFKTRILVNSRILVTLLFVICAWMTQRDKGVTFKTRILINSRILDLSGL